MRKSKEESSLLHVVPHGKVVKDFEEWDLSVIALTMDEALVSLSELGVRVGKLRNGFVMLRIK
eukprot:6914908-Karenia_brevis.AAC.1